MHGRRISRLVTYALLAGLVGAATASAGNGIHLTGVGASCGTTINTKVTLTGDLNCSGFDGTAITIGAGGSLDLGGFTLTVHTGDTGVASAATGTISVANGTIAGASTAVSLTGSKVLVGSLTITGASIGIAVNRSPGGTIQKNTISSPSTYGISLANSSLLTVSGNTLSSAAADDILSSNDYKDTVTANTVTTINSGNENGIALVNCLSGNVAKNTVTGPTNLIVLLSGAGNTVSQNTLSVTGPYYGVDLERETHDSITTNTQNGNSSNATGFYDNGGAYNTFAKNTASHDNYGFYFNTNNDGPVTATGNTSDGAAAYGFYTYYAFNGADNSGPQTSITGNVAKNGTGVGFYDEYSIHATYKGNTASGNAGDGFSFNEPSLQTITGNVSASNGGNGFLLANSYSVFNASSFTANKATGNTSWGIYLPYSVLKSSGNAASGNGAGNCFGLVCK